MTLPTPRARRGAEASEARGRDFHAEAAVMWRSIPNWPKYEVSQEGQIRRNGRVLSPWLRRRYLTVHLSDGQRHKFISIHRAVVLAFIGPIECDLQVNHLDGVKTNNRVENLQITTCAENREHAAILGLTARGRQNGNGKLTEKEVRQIRVAFDALPRTAGGYVRGVDKIATKYRVTPRNVRLIARREAWKHVD